MAHTRTGMRDGVFWGTTAVFFAAIFAGAIGYVFARFYGAGWLSGGALGMVVLLVAGIILLSTANAATLPGPNEAKTPVAPPGGAFQAPLGGAFRAPDAPPPSARSQYAAPAREPQPPASFAEMSQSAGEAVGKAAYSASAAVTSAAQAARDAISDVVGPSSTSSSDRAPDPTPPDPVRDTTMRDATPMMRDTTPAAASAVAPGDAERPPALEGPREGRGDDLKRIRGVGPKLEELLQSLGIWHFDQIAGWGPSELAWVDSNLEGFNGRATRDDWVGQSKILAAGGETEHSQRVDRGEST